MAKVSPNKVLEQVYRYGDIPSINSVTQSRNVDIWRERLDVKGFYYKHSLIRNLSYKDVYKTLDKKDFDVDKAYIYACERDDSPTVLYLSPYVGVSLYKECIRHARNKDIIDSQNVDDNIDDILLEALGDTKKLEYLLEHYSPKNIIPIVLTTASTKSQIIVVKHLTLKDLRSYLDLITRMEVGKLIENMEYTFNIHRSIDLALVNSTKSWIKGKPSRAAVNDAIMYAISSWGTYTRSEKERLKVLRLIFSLSNKKYLEDVMRRASMNNLPRMCLLLTSLGIDPNETIIKAIMDNNIQMCQTLLKYTTQSHLLLANSLLGRIEIYNILLIHLSNTLTSI